MSAFLSPIFGAGWQCFNNQGQILAGGKIRTRLAQSSTNQATWTDSTQATQNANPIILDSAGRVPNSIWLANNVAYKFELLDEDNNSLGSWDNITGINITNPPQSEWVSSGLTPSYVSASSYTFPGDQTTVFHANRRIQYTLNTGTYYGYISSSSYNSGTGLTTVNVTVDATALDNTLSAVSYAFISATNTSIPQQYIIAASQANPSPTGNGNKLAHVNSGGTAYEIVSASTPIASTLSFDSTHGINTSKTTVASATTPDIWTNTGNVIDYTGATPATGFAAAPQAGAQRTLVCAAAAVFTAGANMLIDGVASGQSYTATAGDRVSVLAVTTTQFRLHVDKQDGSAVAGGIDSVGSVVTTSTTLTTTSSKYQRVQMAAMGQSLTAPDATGLTVGGPKFVIDNSDGGYPVGWRDSTGVLVSNCVAAGGVAEVYLVDNSTAAGSWSVIGTNLEPGLITIDSTFSSTYASTVLKPFVALDNNKSIHFLPIASNGFAAVAVDKTTGAVGTPLTITTTASSVPKICFKITSTTAVVFYGESTATLRAAVISLSGATTLSVGTAAALSANGAAVEDSFTASPKIAQLDSTHYLVSYATATGAGTTSVAALEVTTGTTVTWGSAANIIAANNVIDSTTTYALTSTTALVLYKSGAGAPYANNAVVISVSGTTCTVGTPAALTNCQAADTNPPSSCLLSPTKAIVADTNNTTNATAISVAISGTTVTAGTALNVETGVTAGMLYDSNLATRNNPHLSALSSSTALLWYVVSNISRAVVLSESGGTITAGSILYRSISIAGSGTTGFGLMCQQGTSEFLVFRQEGASNGWHNCLVPHKISGTTITEGVASRTIIETATTTALGASTSAVRLSSGDYLTAPHLRGRAITVCRSNGDFVMAKGEVQVPIASNATSWNGIQGVSPNRVVYIFSAEGTTVSASTNQLRILSMEIAA